MKIINATHEGKMGGGCEAIDIHFDEQLGKPDISGEANEGRPSRPFFLISGAAAN